MFSETGTWTRALIFFSRKRGSIAHGVSLCSAHHPDISVEQDVKLRAIHPYILMVEENTYFTDQLSPLEGYPLTLCGVTSRIKAGRLSISVKCQILYTPSSCFGVARNRFE